MEEREKKCWVTTVLSGHRELGDVPVDRVLRGLVETARHGSDGAFHASWPPPFVRDGYQCVEAGEVYVVSVLLDEPGWQDERR